MRLAIFDDYRLGIVSPDGHSITDVSTSLPWPHDADPLGAGWWVRMCRDFDGLRGALESGLAGGRPVPLQQVRLRAPVLNPTKIVAAASNYAAHVQEMIEVRARTGAGGGEGPSKFDVFLKAPSSIIGPDGAVLLPPVPVAEGKEIHHESELAVIVGHGGRDISEADALTHVLGYTIGLDMTVRGAGDRSRRKSYDTFTPLGPWITTADEVGNPHDLHITLTLNDTIRQDVPTSEMDTKVPGIIAYASSVMRLEPGDVILTGAPPGVGQVHDGDVMEATITRVGSLRLSVRAASRVAVG